MPASLTKQILSADLVEGDLSPGAPISLRMDQALLQDATGTMALMQFEELAVPRMQLERAVQYVDHNVVQLDYKNADDHRMLQALARKHGLHFSRPGNGISHYIHMERFGRPGHTLLGADSHTTQGGCLGMVAIGAGGLDVAVVLGGHPYEIACPEVVEVHLVGALQRPWVQAKDIILELLRRLSASGGKNKVFEFTGPGPEDLRIPARARIAQAGVYRQLSDGGVRMLEPVCGPCVGMGQAPPSDSNSLRTFNRNFPGRSGTPEDSVFLCSPAVAAVSLLTGKIEDPREYGDAPDLLPMPELRPYVDDVHIFAPAEEEEAEKIEIPRGPNIKRPPEHKPMGDSIEARVATVQPDDTSTRARAQHPV